MVLVTVLMRRRWCGRSLQPWLQMGGRIFLAGCHARAAAASAPSQISQCLSASLLNCAERLRRSTVFSLQIFALAEAAKRRAQHGGSLRDLSGSIGSSAACSDLISVGSWCLFCCFSVQNLQNVRNAGAEGSGGVPSSRPSAPHRAAVADGRELLSSHPLWPADKTSPPASRGGGAVGFPHGCQNFGMVRKCLRLGRRACRSRMYSGLSMQCAKLLPGIGPSCWKAVGWPSHMFKALSYSSANGAFRDYFSSAPSQDGRVLTER